MGQQMSRRPPHPPPPGWPSAGYWAGPHRCRQPSSEEGSLPAGRLGGGWETVPAVMAARAGGRSAPLRFLPSWTVPAGLRAAYSAGLRLADRRRPCSSHPHPQFWALPAPSRPCRPVSLSFIVLEFAVWGPHPVGLEGSCRDQTRGSLVPWSRRLLRCSPVAEPENCHVQGPCQGRPLPHPGTAWRTPAVLGEGRRGAGGCRTLGGLWKVQGQSGNRAVGPQASGGTGCTRGACGSAGWAVSGG